MVGVAGDVEGAEVESEGNVVELVELGAIVNEGADRNAGEVVELVFEFWDGGTVVEVGNVVGEVVVVGDVVARPALTGLVKLVVEVGIDGADCAETGTTVVTKKAIGKPSTQTHRQFFMHEPYACS